jgi:predicted RNA-binding Zn-ribbon protein involved in translation (DUF1610 family)
MDEDKGKKKPRYCLYRCDPKYPPTGDPVRKSDKIDDLREYMFPRWKDENKTPLDRLTLTEMGIRINIDRLRIPAFEDFGFGKLRGKEVQGNGWYCKNTNCERLIATDEIKAFGAETLLRLTCPHCGDHDYYRCSEHSWKNRERA